MFKKLQKLTTSLLAGLLVTSMAFGYPLQFQTITLIHAESATTPYSWNNEIPEKTPDASKDNGKLVLFDNTHGSTTGSADWVIDGAFSDFADALTNEGYTVREYRGVDKNNDGIYRFYDDRQTNNVSLNEAIITYDAIKDADVFVLAESNRPFRQSEYNALIQFVEAGKGIFFISDHYNADRNKNTWDSTEVFNGYNRSSSSTYNMGGEYGDQRNPKIANSGWLSENFGIRFRFNGINCMSGVSDIRSTTDSEGITSGVDPILMAAGCTLAITDSNKAKGIIYLADNDSATKWNYAVDEGIYYGGEDEGPFVAISKPGIGKAAFIGDSSPIEDITPKYTREENGNPKKTYDGWQDTGTAASLAVNIINWLATPESYTSFDGINHSKGILTPNPMSPSEIDTPQTEPWSTPSYDPWNADTFAYGSYGAPYGPGGTIDPPPISDDTGVFISEYIEGSSYNKGIEIYNGTNSTINLSNYSLVQFNNGSNSETFSLSLSGTLNSGDVFVVVNANANASMKAVADLKTTNSVMNFNGDDAIALKNASSIIDIIGKIGEDPGTEWGSDLTSTKNNTLVRKEAITSGDSDNSDTFIPSSQWYGYAIDTISHLGQHTIINECNELFFSEYIEGSSYNKALEIYNGTNSTIDLSEYSIHNYSNGRTTPLFSLTLSGTLTPNNVYVIANTNAINSIISVADLQTSNGIMDFNGDDTIVLKHNDIIIDVIGQIGIDPGSEWGIGNASTKNNTIIRKFSVSAGDNIGTDIFNPADEWDGYATDIFDNLGTY